MWIIYNKHWTQIFHAIFRSFNMLNKREDQLLETGLYPLQKQEFFYRRFHIVY